MIVDNLRHSDVQDPPYTSVYEWVELSEMVVSDGPAFTAPKEDINNILQEDLVFEVQFNILVVEEMT